MFDALRGEVNVPVFERGSSSIRARRQHVVDVLRSVGAGRLSDAFLWPVAESPSNVSAMSPRVEIVRWRDHEARFYVRAEAVPFDLLPFRANAPERIGAHFSIGPGLSRDGTPHPAVLLVQVEGPDAEPLADAIERAVVDAVAPPLRARASDGEHVRVCLASHVLLPRSAP